MVPKNGSIKWFQKMVPESGSKKTEKIKNSGKYYYYRRLIGDLLETIRRPIGDVLETHKRPTRLIEDPSGPTFLIGDQHASWDTHWTCLIKHLVLRWVSHEACWSPMRHFGVWSVMLFSDQVCRSSIRHVGLRLDMLVFNGSPMDLWWG